MARKIEVEIVGDSSSYQRALGHAQKQTSTFGKAAKLALIGGAAAGFYALGKAAKIGWDEFNAGQKEAAQTRAVIKSTGGAANVTAKHVQAMGEKLMNVSGIDDELVVAGENLLLTFRNIRNEVGKGNDIFDQATELTLDLATAMHTDMNSAAIQVGKALNDPIRGYSRLQRIGVTFSDTQVKLIEHFDKLGDRESAQKVILRELQKEFGGSAKAAGTTLAGKIAVLQERFRNFAGHLVGSVLPALVDFVDFIDRIADAKNITAKIRVIFQGIGDAARGFVDALGKAIFGETKRTPLKLPSGQIVEWKTEHSQGLVDAISEGISAADWSKVGAGMAAGIKDAFVSAASKIPATPEDFVRAIGLDPDKDYSKVFDNWLRGQMSRLGHGILEGLKPDWGKGGKWISDQLGLDGAKKMLGDFAGWIGTTWKGMKDEEREDLLIPEGGEEDEEDA